MTPSARLSPTRASSACAAAVVLLLGVGRSPAAAQSHYWSDHFGNESILLNGVVIGSVTDAGAISTTRPGSSIRRTPSCWRV